MFGIFARHFSKKDRQKNESTEFLNQQSPTPKQHQGYLPQAKSVNHRHLDLQLPPKISTTFFLQTIAFN